MSKEYKSDYFDIVYIDEIHEIDPIEIPREWGFQGIDGAIVGRVQSPELTEQMLKPQRRKSWLLQWFEDKIREMEEAKDGR